MKKICLLFAGFALLLGTGCSLFQRPEEHMLSLEDTGKTLDVHTGDLLIITLPTDTEELRSWKVASPHSSAVLMRFDMRYGKIYRDNDDDPEKEEKPLHAVQYFYRVIGPGYTGISYERKGKLNQEGFRAPNERFNLLVYAEGERIEPENIFKNDERPPETMTDSKGNVVPAPRHLLDRNTKPLKKREKTEWEKAQ